VFQHGHTNQWNPAGPAYGRYWVDTPERRKRRTVALGICPSRSTAKRKLREHIEREGINGKEAFATNTAPATDLSCSSNEVDCVTCHTEAQTGQTRNHFMDGSTL
jgi:hypothetical protein